MIVQLEKGVLRRARAVRNRDSGGNFFVLSCYCLLLCFKGLPSLVCFKYS